MEKVLLNKLFGVEIAPIFKTFEHIQDPKEGFGNFLGENAGAGIEDLAVGSKAMEELHHIIENLNIPSLAIGGNAGEIGLKDILKVDTILHGLAHMMLTTAINHKELPAPVDSKTSIFTLMNLKKNKIIKKIINALENKTDWKKNDHDFLAPLLSQLGNGLNITKTLVVPAYHDSLHSGEFKGAIYGNSIAIKNICGFINQELRKKLKVTENPH